MKCVDTSVIEDSMNGKAQGGSSIKFLQFSHVAGCRGRKAKGERRKANGQSVASGSSLDNDATQTKRTHAMRHGTVHLCDRYTSCLHWYFKVRSVRLTTLEPDAQFATTTGDSV